MLLLLLVCMLPTATGKSCLHCWPELPAVVDYDLQILWGSPGPPVELSQHLHTLFQEKHSATEPWYLAHDHLEKEMARFFNHIDEAITKFRDDKSLLLIEVDNYKKLFLERLRKISKGLKEKACNKSCVLQPDLEVINCVTCGHHQLSCNDSTLCPAWNPKVLMWIACVWIFLFMGAAAGGGYYYFYWRKKKVQQGEKESKGIRGTEAQAGKEAGADSPHPGPSLQSHDRWPSSPKGQKLQFPSGSSLSPVGSSKYPSSNFSRPGVGPAPKL